MADVTILRNPNREGDNIIRLAEDKLYGDLCIRFNAAGGLHIWRRAGDPVLDEEAQLKLLRVLLERHPLDALGNIV